MPAPVPPLDRNTVEAEHGAVGALVNNAGYSQVGPVEEVSLDRLQRQFDTNLFGLVRLCQLVLPACGRSIAARSSTSAPPPDDVAKVVVTAVTSRRPKTRYRLGPQAHLAPLVRRLTPSCCGWRRSQRNDRQAGALPPRRPQSRAAPYRHFAGRDQLLAAAAIRASDALAAALTPQTSQAVTPADRLAAAARAYVRFAADHRALFETLLAVGLDKRRHPELQRAAQPVTDAFLGPAWTLCDQQQDAAEDLTVAVAAAAHGHAALLLEGAFGDGQDAVETAAARAASATLALVEGRKALRQPARHPPAAVSPADPPHPGQAPHTRPSRGPTSRRTRTGR